MARNRRVGLIALVAVLLVGGVSVPANAYSGPAVTWSTLCSSYSGVSGYTEPSGMGWAFTVAGDNDEVGAAIRYYAGSTAYNHGYGYAEYDRAAVLYGGYHQSYCFPGTQTHTSSVS